MTECPDLAALLADPMLAIRVPLEAIPRVLTEVAAYEARLFIATNILTARLVRSDGARTAIPAEDDLVGADEAGRRLGMSVGWLYKHASRLPFTRRVGPRSVRFSAEGIHRYLARRARD